MIYKSEVSQNFDTNLVNKGAQVREDFFYSTYSAIPFNEHIKKYYIEHYRLAGIIKILCKLPCWLIVRGGVRYLLSLSTLKSS